MHSLIIKVSSIITWISDILDNTVKARLAEIRYAQVGSGEISYLYRYQRIFVSEQVYIVDLSG